MKIIKRRADNVVLFAGNDLVLDEQGLRGAGWTFRSNIDPNELVLEEAAEIPEGFTGGGWAYADGVWTINALGEQALLSGKRAEKIAELEAARLAMEYSNLEHAGQTWATDKDSRALLAEVLAPGSVRPGAYWRDISGAEHVMTYAEMQALGRAISDRGYDADETLKAKITAVNAATTAAEIEAITW
ncbi:DUF4376 domain-containing protein [Nitrosomonas oligotropha]|uniref:DUF4376 domain-containing protein n=1 Tax=Nitrosomonas oligotropha TaxID=42354 RepID=UPI00136A7B1E|nr:DUF4376 domain-containing protein [Nitrosomonas oligotropha]MXS81583.1 DUF4376 domain-containing protein [Nitrosomonas oligotropha]